MNAVISTVLMTANATTVVKRLGTNMAISTITTTTSSMISLLGRLTTSDQPGVDQIKQELDRYDLDFFIKVLNELVLELENKELSSSVTTALNGVNSSLEKLHKSLMEIEQKIEDHQQAWLSSWRSLSCSDDLTSIAKHKELLYSRYGVLKDVLTIKQI